MPASLISEHCEMCITNEIDHVIRCGHVEAIAEPVHRQVSGCHGVKQEVLQVLLGLRVGEKCFVHAPIISTGSGRSRPIVCHLVNWSEAADQFVSISGSIFDVHDITIVPIFFQHDVHFSVVFFIVFHLSLDVILEVHVTYHANSTLYFSTKKGGC